MDNITTEKPKSVLSMTLLAISVGVIGGVGAVLFRALIGLIHNVLFLGEFSFHYNANLHTAASPWGWAILLVPALGALGVTWIVKNFAPEAKGHGVPEVMYAIYHEGGKIRPIVALVKSIASALSIGSGGSVGREGPIVQIGAAFGSTLGQFLAMPVPQRITLIAAGASAGIAATFNAPIGGLVFSIELMLVSINAATISYVALATVTATYIGRLFLGLTPAFDVPALSLPETHLIYPFVLLACIPFGILVGFVATFFIKAIYAAEDWFDATFSNMYIRHIVGMLALGVIIMLMMQFSGHYYVQGVGYATIYDILNGLLLNPWFLLLLFAAKMVATCLTLGSGGSGGVFSPSLFLGATLGAAFANFAQMLFPLSHINAITFAIAGMAAMVGSSTGAVITAITMTYELTHDYSAILPVMTVVTVAYGIRKILSKESIYTLKLLRRGKTVPEGLQSAMVAARRVSDMLTTDFSFLELSEIVGHPDLSQSRYHIVHDNGSVLGLLRKDYLSLRPEIRQEHIEKLIDKNFVIATPDQRWVKLFRNMWRQHKEIAIVCTNPALTHKDQVYGVITEHEIARAAANTAQLVY